MHFQGLISIDPIDHYFIAATAHGTATVNPFVSLPPKPPPTRFVLQTTRFAGISKQCATLSCQHITLNDNCTLW